MLKWIFAAITALFLAGGVHALTVLSLPYLADTSLRAQIGNAELEPNRFFTLTELNERGVRLGGYDPNLKIAICPIDLSEGPVSVHAPLFPGYWSISVFDVSMNNITVFNKSSFLNVSSEIVIGAEARNAILASEDSIISVILPDIEGFAMLRLMAGLEYFMEEKEQVLRSARCKPWRGR